MNPVLRLTVLSLRYSSWSIRPWLALRAAGASFETETVVLPDLATPIDPTGSDFVGAKRQQLADRRAQGSVTGFFPVLHVDGIPIHESLAICEWVAESYPEAGLWPAETIDRARARAVCCEMASDFSHLRGKMPCNVFARVPGFEPDRETMLEIDRVLEIWRGSLQHSGGPFLFGAFGIADAMYFPVLKRFRTYGISLGKELEVYAEGVESHPAVEAWRSVARQAPPIPSYDHAIRELGGDPEALL